MRESLEEAHVLLFEPASTLNTGKVQNERTVANLDRIGSRDSMAKRTGRTQLERCPWAKTELYVQYHDSEWGVPVHDDRLLFEFLILEGAQAGLSWETILKKRESYRAAFDNFDPAIVARYDQNKRQSLLSNPGIIRNRLKIEAAIQNAKAFLAVQEDMGTFDEYIWGLVGHESKQNSWRSINEVPAQSPESDIMSKDLKRRGFTFVGSTICYAFMQAVGMVNDHVVDCFRHVELRKSGRARR
jgi:DNA-3-methyladenine glycosylase I